MLGILAESLRIAALTARPQQPAPAIGSGAPRQDAGSWWRRRKTVTD